MLNPFIELITNIIFLINLSLTVWIILGLLIHFDIVNRYSPIVSKLYTTLSRLLEPMLEPIRKHVTRYLPNFGGVDLSPVILWLILRFINSALISWFYIEPLMTSANIK